MEATAAIHIVEQVCSFATDMSSGKVTVESNNDDFPRAIEELEHANARNLAIGYAAQRGMGDTRVNGNLIGPYAVNAQGVPLDEVKGTDGQPLPAKAPAMQPAAYRVEVPVCRKLV